MSRTDERRSWVIVAGGFHQSGGMDKANAALARHLLDRGIRLHLVAHAIDATFAGSSGAVIHRVARPAGSTALGERLLARRGRLVARHVAAADPRTRVVVNGGNCRWPDVNWVHYVHDAWRPARARGNAVFRARAAFLRWLDRRRERRAISCARLVVVNSERTRSDTRALPGVDPARVVTIYLGSDATGPVTPDERSAARRWLGVPEGEPLVAFVGPAGFDERKGFDTLWSAWQRLGAEPGWRGRLVVAGRCAPRRAAEVRGARCGDRVMLLGHSDRVPEVLAASDLLVSPTRYEPYGLNVQEAICRGLPVLVSRGAGIAERFPPALSDMTLADPDSPEELAGKLRCWVTRQREWAERVAPVSSEFRARSWDDMARAFVSAVDAVPPV
jgi:glycosyltransferase involved in cell wall biosynthesis